MGAKSWLYLKELVDQWVYELVPRDAEDQVPKKHVQTIEEPVKSEKFTEQELWTCDLAQKRGCLPQKPQGKLLQAPKIQEIALKNQGHPQE